MFLLGQVKGQTIYKQNVLLYFDLIFGGKRRLVIINQHAKFH